ncbi:Dihydropteroate synthase [Meredithblackwellia eburnea MCA 4105]
MGRDVISITSLELRSSKLEQDLWQRNGRVQPLVANLQISTNVSGEATTDSLSADSLNYGTVTRAIEGYIDRLESSTELLPLEYIAEEIAKVVLFQASAPNLRLTLERRRALLTAESVGVEIYRERKDYEQQQSSLSLRTTATNPLDDKLFVKKLSKNIIIGVNPCERVDEQQVLVDLEFLAPITMTPYSGALRTGWQGWRAAVQGVEAHLASTKPETIEAITTSLASLILTPPSQPPSSSSPPTWDIPCTSVRLSKPSALIFAKYPAVQVTRSRADFYSPSGQLGSSTAFSSQQRFISTSGTSSSSPTTAGNSTQTHSVIIAVGTNMGSRVSNISQALRELENDEQAQAKVVDQSFLYESDAMYVTDQARFLNAVVKIETTLTPPALLGRLKAIEDSLGRVKTIRNGPRVIDLDILFYDNLVFESDPAVTEKDRWLKVPHASIAEREFVLRPLADIAADLVHPVLHRTTRDLLTSLLSHTPSSLHRVLPLSSTQVHTIGSRTLLMSILNATPDSFSDGGDNFVLASALTNAKIHTERGVDILDIGGMSTRPGAKDVGEDEEIDRVVPLIKSIREAGLDIPISVDTFRPKVAKAAVEAGATIINDVLGGAEEGMLDVMREMDVPVVLMHSRGDPMTMGKLTEYEDGVVTGVRKELGEKVKNALAMGVKRWNIILDPGIGFAKTGDDNAVLLKNLPASMGRGGGLKEGDDRFLGEFPSLVGLSRKKFLGTLTGKTEPKDRIFATAAGVTASIAGGADVVRVHDVEMGKDVLNVADAIYRK